MPNKPRKLCESNVYHVTQRGVGQLDIFENDADRILLANLLASELKDHEATVFSWCFMSDHIHLLLQAEMRILSKLMQVAESQYVRRFNVRHLRSGALFQSRFETVPVQTDAQFLTVVRYIHRNPVTARMCARCEDYMWSSFRQYTNRPLSRTLGMVDLRADTKMALELAGGEREFENFHHSWPHESQIDMTACISPSDDEMRSLAYEVLHGLAASDVGKLPKDERDAAIRVLKQNGFKLRLIQRLTGINFSAIRNA